MAKRADRIKIELNATERKREQSTTTTVHLHHLGKKKKNIFYGSREETSDFRSGLNLELSVIKNTSFL